MFGKFYIQDGAAFCAVCPGVNVTRYEFCMERGGRSTPKCSRCGAWLAAKPRKRNTIKKLDFDATYQEIRKLTHANGDGSNCTVVAATVCTGRPYAEVDAMFVAAGRVRGRGFSLLRTLDIIQRCGKELVQVNPRYFIDRYPGAHKGLRSVTTHHMDRFRTVWRDGKTYFIDCRSHVCAVKDGVMMDWSRSSARRVIAIYEVRDAHVGV